MIQTLKPFEEGSQNYLSISGTGLIFAATILAEIGDFRNFPSADKMAAYFGIVLARSEKNVAAVALARKVLPFSINSALVREAISDALKAFHSSISKSSVI